MRIILIRHVFTTQNKWRKIKFDKSDLDISPDGVEEALNLKSRINSSINPASVIISSAKRTRQTAELIFPEKLSEFVINRGFDEVDKGFEIFSGENPDKLEMNLDDWERSYGSMKNGTFDAMTRYPSGVTLADFILKVQKIFASVVRENNNGDIVIVSHNGPIKAMLLYALANSGFELYPKIEILSGAYTEIAFSGGHFKLVKLNA